MFPKIVKNEENNDLQVQKGGQSGTDGWCQPWREQIRLFRGRSREFGQIVRERRGVQEKLPHRHGNLGFGLEINLGAVDVYCSFHFNAFQ